MSCSHGIALPRCDRYTAYDDLGVGMSELNKWITAHRDPNGDIVGAHVLTNETDGRLFASITGHIGHLLQKRHKLLFVGF